MSAGQTQFFSLTRAILQLKGQSQRANRKAILLLDEVTSSVDPAAEATMRRIIKEAFTDNGHTVIEITHRMKGIKGAAVGELMVVVLSHGRVQKHVNFNNAVGIDGES
jgi:ABC-type transport system involved in cytochrome bd biosynthesis fused ATPase/permease subunit